MLEAGLREAGCRVFSNRSGANLRSGITTEFILHTSVLGKPKNEWAVIECDEAASAQVFAEIQPRVVLVTNLFRDQLDRYGEIFYARDCIRQGLCAAPEAVVCLNTDCPLTASLAKQIGNRVLYFGVEERAAGKSPQPSTRSDAAHCLRCGAKYSYRYLTYAHLGGYYCPVCGDSRKPAAAAVTEITEQAKEGSTIVWRLGEKQCTAELRLPGMYQLYNATGAAAVMNAIGIGTENITRAVSSFHGAFGRMEKLKVGETDCTMILVKNPAAFNQALEDLRKTDGAFVLVLGLNDHAADGRDISWIWDIDLELLMGMVGRIEQIILFGSRYADMALRLKYAGVPEAKFTLAGDCSGRKTAALIKEASCPVYILPTYTAMLQLRRTLIKKHGAAFWG